MSIVLFEKVLVLLDSIQERVEQIDKAKSLIVSSIVRNFPSGSHRTKLHYAWLRYAEESLS